MRLDRILTILIKERRTILRDRMFFLLAFLVPAMLLLAFGFGLSLDVSEVPLVICDYDASPMSREYSYRFISSPYFGFQGSLKDEREIQRLLSDNRIRAALIIPDGFQERILEGRPEAVQVLIDGTFPYRAQTVKEYVNGINHDYSLEILAEHLSRTRGIPLERALKILNPVTPEIRYLYNQSLNDDWSLPPKWIMVIMIICSPLLTALGVVREKESGAIYNIYASTVTRLEYLVGKLLPYLIITFINSLILWFLTLVLFGAPFKGSPALFMGVSLIYAACTTGIGLIVSILVRTQVAASLVTFIVTVLPAMLYSGIFIPIHSLGPGARFVAAVLPAMYYTNVISGCFLKGVGLEVLWWDVLVLAAYAAGLLTLGYLMFRKRLSR